MRLIKRILRGVSYPAKAVARYLLHEDIKELNKLILYVQDQQDERISLEVKRICDRFDGEVTKLKEDDVFNDKRVEELTEKLDDEMSEIDYSAIKIDYHLLGNEIDYYNLVQQVEYSDIAEHIDIDDVAAELDTEAVATSLSELISVSIKLK